MSLRLRIYLGFVALLAATALGLGTPHNLATLWPHYAAWVVICIISESLWITTLSGTGTVSMASTAGLAAGFLWGPATAMWIVAASTLIAELFVQRKPAIRASFNAAQGAITIGAATGVFVLFGGPANGLVAVPDLAGGEATALRLVLPTLAMFAVYLLVSRFLVTVAVAWSTDRPYLRVLREDWFYTERLLEDSAAFLISPLMVLSFQTIGYVGVVLFYVPLRILNESARRYLELQRAQNQLIHSERMAAKGEMAAEIGHELRNQLASISGRAQMLTMEARKETFADVERHADIILQQTKRVEAMSHGLMAFTRAEVNVEPLDINELIRNSIEFVRTQNRFDDLEWDIRLTEGVPQLRADPGQLQQVLINLFMNGADAMKETTGKKLLRVTSEHHDKSVVITVSDSGSGIEEQHRSRIFEPHFTTKTAGHGFGLSTSYRIIANHGGRIVAESPPGRGACFIITMPVAGPGGSA